MRHLIALLLLLSTSLSAQYNFFPLQEGDTLHYLSLWSLNTLAGLTSDTSYYKDVVTSTTVDNYKYYKVRDGYYSYDQNEQKLYTLLSGQRILAVDFTTPSGSYFLGNLLGWSNNFQSYGISSEGVFRASSRNSYPDRQVSDDFSFASGIGLTNYSDMLITIGYGSEADFRYLIEARGHNYSLSFKTPTLTVPSVPFYKPKADFPFNIPFTITHPYIQLIDSLCAFINVYRNNNLILSRTSKASRGNTGGNISCFVPIDFTAGDLMVGDVVKIKFLLTDTSLSKNRIIMPADGSTYNILVVESKNWVLQSPYPTSNNLTGVDYRGGVLWVVGDAGTVLRSTDEGNLWDDISYNNNEYNFSSVSFPDFSTGYATTGGISTVFKTTNAGLTWAKQDLQSYNSLSKIWFPTENTGIILGDGTSFSYYTQNGGLEWSSKPIIMDGYNGIAVKDTNDAIVVGYSSPYCPQGQYGFILKTTDQGATFTQPLKVATGFTSACFVDENLAFAAGDYLYKSTNSGTTWTKVGWFYPSSMIAFSDSMNGLSLYNGKLTRSTDGGLLWNDVNTGTDTVFTIVKWLNKKTYLLFGQKGLILKTIDGGNNWLPVYKGSMQTLYGSFMVDNNNAYAVGAGGTIMKTVNGGGSWYKASTSTNAVLNSVYFSGASSGMAVGNGGVILITLDAGYNWVTISSGVTNNLNSVCLVNNNIGYIAGSGVILKTTDGGITWTSKTVTGKLNSISFTDENNGTAVGDNGVILRTTDGGDTWVQQQINVTINLKSVSFLDALNGVAAGNSKTILKTTNGGATWTLNQNLPDVDYRSIKYKAPDNIIAIGGMGIIVKSTDGGNVWTPEEIKTKKLLYSVSVTDSNSIIVGQDGVIFSNKVAPVVSVNDKGAENIVSSFYLSQNYPNPFNPSTKINYSISSPQHVKIVVYDILGREISVLVNEEKTSGRFTTEFNGSKFASGIYFYRLTAGSFMETHKMLLIK
jgi:photosystem II stability/assembly factor-like uncharacterized protein